MIVSIISATRSTFDDVSGTFCSSVAIQPYALLIQIQIPHTEYQSIQFSPDLKCVTAL